MNISFSIKLGIFFSTAVVFALLVQWVRQQPPAYSQTGEAFQVVEALDQSGDLYHALAALPDALRDPESREAALRFQQAVELRKIQAPAVLIALDEEILDTERRYKIPKLTFSKGVIADLLQKDEDAMYWYREVLRMKPEMSIAYVRLALVFERTRQVARAQSLFQQALEVNERAILTHFHHGMFLARATSMFDEARKEAEFLRNIRPLYSRIIEQTIHSVKSKTAYLQKQS